MSVYYSDTFLVVKINTADMWILINKCYTLTVRPNACFSFVLSLTVFLFNYWGRWKPV